MTKKTSRAAVVTSIRHMEMREFPIPEIGDDDGLLKVEMVGVCGSDPGFYNGKTKVPYPLIMGHEIVGRIEKLGKNKAKSTGLKEGDRVVVENRFGCGKCKNCIAGKYAQCTDRLGYGVYYGCDNPPYLWGAYSEYLYLPARAMLHKISEDVPLEAAVLTTSVFGNNVRWLGEVGGVTLGDTVLITGCGQQGIAGTVVARELGATKVIVVGTSDPSNKERIELCKEFGATDIIYADTEDVVERVKEITNGELADVMMDVSGAVVNMELSVDLVRKMGTVVVPGLYGKHFGAMDWDKVTQKELVYKGALAQSYHSNEVAIRLIESRKYPLEKMVTHKFALEDAEKAVLTTAHEIESDRPPIKCVICPNGLDVK